MPRHEVSRDPLCASGCDVPLPGCVNQPDISDLFLLLPASSASLSSLGHRGCGLGLGVCLAPSFSLCDFNLASSFLPELPFMQGFFSYPEPYPLCVTDGKAQPHPSPTFRTHVSTSRCPTPLARELRNQLFSPNTFLLCFTILLFYNSALYNSNRLTHLPAPSLTQFHFVSLTAK